MISATIEESDDKLRWHSPKETITPSTCDLSLTNCAILSTQGGGRPKGVGGTLRAEAIKGKTHKTTKSRKRIKNLNLN